MLPFILIPLLIILVRLVNILAYPLYIDEGIYIFWAKLFDEDINFAYISLQDGKTPLYIWLISAVYDLTGQALYSGRLISAVAGGVTAFAWMMIARLISDKRVAVVTGILLLILPFANFIERLAFADSLLTALASMSLLFWVFGSRLIGKRKGWMGTFICAFFSGLFLGLAFMTKSSTVAIVVCQIAVVLFWMGQEVVRKKLFNAFIYFCSLGIFYFVYDEIVGFLRFGGYRLWGNIEEKQQTLTFTLPEILDQLGKVQGILDYVINAGRLSSYMVYYFSGLLVLLGFGIYLIVSKHRAFVWLLLYSGIFFAGTFLSAKVVASRYFYPAVPALVMICAIGLVALWQQGRKKSAYLGYTLVGVTAFFSSWLISHPYSFFYPSNEAYISGSITAIGLDKSIQAISGGNKPESMVGVHAIWGVTEGAVVGFEEAGIPAVSIEKLFVVNSPDDEGICQENFTLLGTSCWKLNIDQLADAGTKYLYLPGGESLDLISQMHEVHIVEAFSRPRTEAKAYLLEVK